MIAPSRSARLVTDSKLGPARPTLCRVPELPEVEALALDLRGPARRPRHRQGPHRRVQRAEDLRPAAVGARGHPRRRTSPGTASSSTSTASGLHLVLHLARAGWIRWRDEVPTLAAQAEQQVAAGGPGRARRPVRPRHHRGRHQEEPRDVRRPVDPPTCPASPRSGPTRSTDDFTIEVLRGDPRPTPAAPRSRACCATRAPSPASATPTPTSCCTPPGCRRSSRPTA